jgi:hypothetical protein
MVLMNPKVVAAISITLQLMQTLLQESRVECIDNNKYIFALFQRNTSAFLRMNSLGIFDDFDPMNNFPNKLLKRSA